MEKSLNEKKRILPLLLVPLFVVPLAFAAQSDDSGSNDSSGTYTYTNALTSQQVVSGYTFITYAHVANVVGSLSGPCTGSQVVVIYPDNTFTLQGTCIFVGTVGDSSPGTDVFTYSGSGSLATGRYTIHDSQSDGTGGLAGIEGADTDTGTLGVAGSYTGWYSFNDQ